MGQQCKIAVDLECKRCYFCNQMALILACSECYWLETVNLIHNEGNLIHDQLSNVINRGYYMAVRRYEFYLRLVKTIFYERAIAKRVSKILFSAQDDKIRIFKPPCNVLFII